jgi:acyl carrier protein
MTRDEFCREIEIIVEAPEGSVQADAALTDIGWDSAAVIAFMAMIDEKLGTRVSIDRLKRSVTVQDLIALADE